PALPPAVAATLVRSVANGGSRRVFHPARLSRDGSRLMAEAIPTRGSHDVVAHARAGGLLVLEPGVRLAAGERVGVLLPTDETTLGAWE
ncbi:MAG TPA: hypothetical protein VL084_10990, partial [Thermoanaerobaculia bacterium]|nr:hypothetical protein [Thermoanaerobaculia bacterium]